MLTKLGRTRHTRGILALACCIVALGGVARTADADHRNHDVRSSRNIHRVSTYIEHEHRRGAALADRDAYDAGFHAGFHTGCYDARPCRDLCMTSVHFQHSYLATYEIAYDRAFRYGASMRACSKSDTRRSYDRRDRREDDRRRGWSTRTRSSRNCR